MTDPPPGAFHHIGVAVTDIEAATRQFQAVFSAVAEPEIIEDENQQVRIRFLRLGGLRVELLQPLSHPSPLDPILKRGIAFYQICYEVNDLDAAVAQVTAAGAKIVSPPKPAIAFDNRRVCFITCQGMLVELLEAGHGRGTQDVG